MRRGADDNKWQSVKQLVGNRDQNRCRLLSILSMKETLLLNRTALLYRKKMFLNILDPAHIFPVSTHPHLTYEPLNIITLNRFAHELLEVKINPLTGDNLTEEEYHELLMRIIGAKEFSTLLKWAKDPEIYKQEEQNE